MCHRNLETKAKGVRGVVRQVSDSFFFFRDRILTVGRSYYSLALRDLRKPLTHSFSFLHIQSIETSFRVYKKKER